VIGIESVAKHVINRGLFSDFKYDSELFKADMTDLLGVEECPRRLVELGRKLADQKVGTILTKAGLILEHNEVLDCEVNRVGEHGYQGVLYRISNIKLAIPQPELQESYILKVGEVTTGSVNVLKEAKFHHFVGNLYTSPIIPRIYMATQSRKHPLKVGGYWAMLMKDVTWGSTKECKGGFNMECVLSAVDALAEYHCYQLTCKKQTVDKYLDTGFMVLAKDHFLFKEMKRAVE